jgi:hypothetical protein
MRNVATSASPIGKPNKVFKNANHDCQLSGRLNQGANSAGSPQASMIVVAVSVMAAPQIAYERTEIKPEHIDPAYFFEIGE